MTYSIFNQSMIFILGIVTMFMISRKEEWSKWGFVAGLAAQPFWYYSSITTHQYGILCLNIIYTFCWVQGIYFRFNKNYER